MIPVPDSWPVLTIRQPWEWAIEHAGKPVENRSRYMHYRGPLWLHAGARSRWDPAGRDFRPLRNAWGRWLRDEVPGWPGLPSSDVILGRRTTLIPFGAVSALAMVTGCHHATSCPTSSGDENWPLCTPWSARDQFHIELADVRPLRKPVPYRGALGLWRLVPGAEERAREQLEASGA